MANNNIKTYQVGKTIIKIDRSKCASCATCTLIAPEIFELDEDLICQIKNNPTKTHAKLIQEAVSHCASEAIKIFKLLK